MCGSPRARASTASRSSPVSTPASRSSRSRSSCRAFVSASRWSHVLLSSISSFSLDASSSRMRAISASWSRAISARMRSRSASDTSPPPPPPPPPPSAAGRPPGPDAISARFSASISSFSPRMSFSLGSSFTTALFLICLARSA